METADPRTIRNEMRDMAQLTPTTKDMRLHTGRVEAILKELHEAELGDTMLLLSVYLMYRELFLTERLQNLPDHDTCMTYAIALRFFAREYQRLIT